MMYKLIFLLLIITMVLHIHGLDEKQETTKTKTTQEQDNENSARKVGDVLKDGEKIRSKEERAVKFHASIDKSPENSWKADNQHRKKVEKRAIRGRERDSNPYAEHSPAFVGYASRNDRFPTVA